MRAPLLVDSTIYVDLLRAGLDVGLRLRNRIDNGSVYTCGIIDRRIRD